MEYDLGEAINSITNWITEETFMATVFKNSFASAIMLVVVIFIILSLNYDNLFNKRSRFIKTAVYLTITITAFLFIHYAAIKNKLSKTIGNVEQEQLISDINHSTGVKSSDDVEIQAFAQIETELDNRTTELEMKQYIPEYNQTTPI